MALNRRQGRTAEIWQGRFFDHALRTVRDYWDTVEYIHLNPVKRGLVVKPENWTWSSFAEYAGAPAVEQKRRYGLAIDRVQSPPDSAARI